MGRPSKITEAIGAICYWIRLPGESRQDFEKRRQGVVNGYPYAVRYVIQGY